jgi:hypothetical protein
MQELFQVFRAAAAASERWVTNVIQAPFSTVSIFA